MGRSQPAVVKGRGERRGRGRAPRAGTVRRPAAGAAAGAPAHRDPQTPGAVALTAAAGPSAVPSEVRVPAPVGVRLVLDVRSVLAVEGVRPARCEVAVQAGPEVRRLPVVRGVRRLRSALPARSVHGAGSETAGRGRGARTIAQVPRLFGPASGARAPATAARAGLALPTRRSRRR